MPPETCNCPAGCGRPVDKGAGRAYGYSDPCYRRWCHAGKPPEGPPPPQKCGTRVPDAVIRDRVAKLADLLAAGLTVAEAARQMEVGQRAAEHYAQELIRQQREDVITSPIEWPVPAPPAPVIWHWSDASACRDHEQLFFGPDGERLPEREIREAKAKSLCAVCPVRNECRGYAEAGQVKDGIWGGLTEIQRADDKRRREYDQRNARRRVAARQDENEVAA